MSIASSCGRMAEGTSLVQTQKRPSEHRQLMECLRFPLENDQIPCIPTTSTGIYYPANQFPHGLRAGHCYFCMEAPAPSWTMFPVEKRCWSARSGTGVIGGRSRVPSEKRLPEPDERVFFWDFWEHLRSHTIDGSTCMDCKSSGYNTWYHGQAFDPSRPAAWPCCRVLDGAFRRGCRSWHLGAPSILRF